VGLLARCQQGLLVSALVLVGCQALLCCAALPCPVQDRTIRLWNPHRGVAIKTYTGHGYDVRDVAVVSDNSK
jgi:hypothetical protein